MSDSPIALTQGAHKNYIFSEPDGEWTAFTDLRNELPLTKIRLTEGENLVGLPFDLNERDEYDKCFPPDVYRPMGVTTIHQHTKGVEYVSNLGDTGGWTGSTPTFNPEDGYVIYVSKESALERGSSEAGGDVYIYAEIELDIDEIDIAGSDGGEAGRLGWSLVPYASFKRQNFKDAIKSTDAVEMHDGDGHVFLDGSDWKGTLKDLQCGKSYWMKKNTSGDGTFEIYNDKEDGQVQSSTYLPTYINDIPRKYTEDPANWLYNRYHGMYGNVQTKSDRCRVIWNRAYNWDDQYIIGHRIRFVKKEDGLYWYQPLPVGDNDWIIGFIQLYGVLKVLGATRLNDIKMNTLLSSAVKIDVDNWDPYNDDKHAELLTNPEDYAGGGATYGKHIQAMCDLNVITSSYNDEPMHYLSDTGQNPGGYTNTYFLYFDSTKSKYYWMYETDNKVLANATRAEYNATIWYNNFDSGVFGREGNSRELRPIKSTINV